MTLNILTTVCLALPVAVLAASLTPAEVSITKAQEQISKQPDHAPYYNALAMAYARRARETSDVQFYQKAEDTVQKSLAIAPDNFEALKVKAWLLLGRHEFAKARELATRLNARNPDDTTVYAYLVDANVELGNYKEAVTAAQWLLDLRPGNIAGLTRAAYLRELHGDPAGAIELMQSAYDATPLTEGEERAWLLTQIAHLHLQTGDLHRAGLCAERALEAFPGYHYALGTLAQVRTADRWFDEAVTLLERRYRSAPHAENLYALAEALQLAGRGRDAMASFAEFERKALQESALADNANRELVAYYADVAREPKKALEVAEREYSRRQDIYTLDAYAWALAKNGQYALAQKQMTRALATGVKDARLLYHAGALTLHLGHTAGAARYLNAAAALYSREAESLLAARQLPRLAANRPTASKIP